MAADPNALPVQGPATIGNPLPVMTQPPGAAGSTQTPVQSSSTGANVANVATLPGVAGKTTYITGFIASVGGATGALSTAIAIAGLLGGTLNIAIEVNTTPTGFVSLPAVQFNPPLPASAVNTPITITLPALGAGNLTAGIAAWGFQQ